MPRFSTNAGSGLGQAGQAGAGAVRLAAGRLWGRGWAGREYLFVIMSPQETEAFVSTETGACVLP